MDETQLQFLKMTVPIPDLALGVKDVKDARPPWEIGTVARRLAFRRPELVEPLLHKIWTAPHAVQSSTRYLTEEAWVGEMARSWLRTRRTHRMAIQFAKIQHEGSWVENWDSLNELFRGYANEPTACALLMVLAGFAGLDQTSGVSISSTVCTPYSIVAAMLYLHPLAPGRKEDEDTYLHNLLLKWCAL